DRRFALEGLRTSGIDLGLRSLREIEAAAAEVEGSGGLPAPPVPPPSGSDGDAFEPPLADDADQTRLAEDTDVARGVVVRQPEGTGDLAEVGGGGHVREEAHDLPSGLVGEGLQIGDATAVVGMAHRSRLFRNLAVRAG